MKMKKKNVTLDDLELSDKHYIELKKTSRIIFKYLKLIVQKTKTPLDLSELEKLVK